MCGVSGQTWKRQVLLRLGEMGILVQQDIGFILEKDLAPPQGDNLEQESESGRGH